MRVRYLYPAHGPSFGSLTFLSPGADFHIFQYFVSVVSTTYVDARRRILNTSQYSVTDMSRVTEHGKGVPGESLVAEWKGQPS